jgi:hypothetical protein
MAAPAATPPREVAASSPAPGPVWPAVAALVPASGPPKAAAAEQVQRASLPADVAVPASLGAVPGRAPLAARPVPEARVPSARRRLAVAALAPPVVVPAPAVLPVPAHWPVGSPAPALAARAGAARAPPAAGMPARSGLGALGWGRTAPASTRPRTASGWQVAAANSVRAAATGCRSPAAPAPLHAAAATQGTTDPCAYFAGESSAACQLRNRQQPRTLRGPPTCVANRLRCHDDGCNVVAAAVTV